MPDPLNGRIDFWNIGYPVGALVYLTGVIAVAAVGFAIYRRSRIWRLGMPNPDVGPWGPRLRAAVRAVHEFVGKRRARREICEIGYFP